MANKYPIKDGWFHLKLKLQKGAKPFSKQDLLSMLGFGDVDQQLLEVAEFKTGKSSQTIIVRRKHDTHIQ